MRKPDRIEPPALLSSRWTDYSLYYRNRSTLTSRRDEFADGNPQLDSLTIWGKMKKQQADESA